MPFQSSFVVPVTLQEVTLVADQLSLVPCPERRSDGSARMERSGEGIPAFWSPSFTPLSKVVVVVVVVAVLVAVVVVVGSAQPKVKVVADEVLPPLSCEKTFTVFVPGVTKVWVADCWVPEGTYPEAGTNWSAEPLLSQSIP